MTAPSALVDRYLALARSIRRLEEERDEARAALVEALGEARGTFRGRGGAVRVLERPTCRFPVPRVLAALEEARFLRDVATLNGPRLRRAMDENLALARVVAPWVEPASYTYVGAVPVG